MFEGKRIEVYIVKLDENKLCSKWKLFLKIRFG